MISKAQQKWLRTFPILGSFGDPTPVEGVQIDEAPIPELAYEFWSSQTKSLEKIALAELSDSSIDAIFEEVTLIIDEDLLRFDPMVHFFAQHYPDGDPFRIELEREVALCVKRDLSWMTVEQVLGKGGFFSHLRGWYNLGRWPHGWIGQYPSGVVLLT